MRCAIVLGTRPEIIKMAPVVRACIAQEIPFYILHTGQHYDRNMDGAFFEDLALPAPDYNLHVGSGPHGQQTGRMMVQIEHHKAKLFPRVGFIVANRRRRPWQVVKFYNGRAHAVWGNSMAPQQPDAPSAEQEKVLADAQDRGRGVEEAHEDRGPEAIWEIPDYLPECEPVAAQA